MSKWHEDYEKAVDEFKWKNQGVYSDGGPKWKLMFSTETDFKPEFVLQRQNKRQAPYDAIVEYVFNGYSF